jgi:opacity protein-like surface antigen
MKKLILIAFAVSLLTPAAFAEFGLGVKLGAGQNDPKRMQALFDNGPGNRKITKSPAFFSLEGLYEDNLFGLEDANKLGFKLGVDIYGQNEYKNHTFNYKVTETTYALPLSVYYKYDPGIKKVAFYGGVGITFISTKIENNSNDESKSKVFPHIIAGAEYRFAKLFALGLDLKYNISAKVEKDSTVMSDRSGFGGALAARFYF